MRRPLIIVLTLLLTQLLGSVHSQSTQCDKLANRSDLRHWDPPLYCYELKLSLLGS